MYKDKHRSQSLRTFYVNYFVTSGHVRERYVRHALTSWLRAVDSERERDREKRNKPTVIVYETRLKIREIAWETNSEREYSVTGKFRSIRHDS
jgi:hypothetical protein